MLKRAPYMGRQRGGQERFLTDFVGRALSDFIDPHKIAVGSIPYGALSPRAGRLQRGAIEPKG